MNSTTTEYEKEQIVLKHLQEDILEIKKSLQIGGVNPPQLPHRVERTPDRVFYDSRRLGDVVFSVTARQFQNQQNEPLPNVTGVTVVIDWGRQTWAVQPIRAVK